MIDIRNENPLQQQYNDLFESIRKRKGPSQILITSPTQTERSTIKVSTPKEVPYRVIQLTFYQSFYDQSNNMDSAKYRQRRVEFGQNKHQSDN